MTRIAIISDTHHFLDPRIFDYLDSCQEVWHAGDFGTVAIADQISKTSGLPVRGVFGNIDGQDVRSRFPEQEIFYCEEMKIMMRHIGGYPPRYNPETKKELQLQRPNLFVAGHSHILKIMFDEKLSCLHINPGAAGKQGWHKVRTLVRIAIDGQVVKDCEVIELGTR